MANYQLAISNIAWLKDDDEAVYTAMQQAGNLAALYGVHLAL